MTVQLNVDGLAMKQTEEVLVEDNDGDDWWAYAHQLRTRQLWAGSEPYDDVSDSVVALNHAPTGAGKTQSWADPTVRLQENVLAMYPTKPLINDQHDSLKQILEDKYDVVVNSPLDDTPEETEKPTLGLAKFTDDTCSEYREKMANVPGNGNGQVFSFVSRRLDAENDFVIALTNPDIFSNIRKNVYKGSLARQVSGLFDTVVVDEFHHAGLKGQHSLVFLIEQMRREQVSETSRCMLLSATPEKDIQKKLQAMDTPFIELNEEDDTKPLSEVTDNDSWRAVLPYVDLEVRRGQTFDTGEELVSQKYIDDTLSFCSQEERTVIILDSIEEVDHVCDTLNEHIGDSHLVDRIHGRTPYSDVPDILDSFNSSDHAVLVTNSAGEIGIDYDATQLIFSGSNPSKLMQRFGRLRNRSDEVRAIAYVPHRAYELFKTVSQESRMVTRDGFEKLVEAGYEEVRRPQSFPPTFGSLEAYNLLHSIKQKSAPEEQERIENEGIEMIRQQYYDPYGVSFDKDQFQRRYDRCEDVVESLMDFRSSQPSALIYNKRQGTIDTYNVMSLLRTGDIDIVSEGEFFSRVPNHLHNRVRSKSSHTFGYVIWRGNERRKREQQSADDESITPRNVSLICSPAISDMLAEDVTQRAPRRLRYFQLYVESNDLSPVDPGPINEAIQETQPLAYIVESDRYTAQSTLELDDFFFLSSVVGPGDEVSIALSHEALYLYCIKQESLWRNNPTTDVDIHVPHELRDDVIQRPLCGDNAESPALDY